MAHSRKSVLPPQEQQSTVDRLRDIAMRSRDALLLAEGPPHPDAELLALCADAVHLLLRSKDARNRACDLLRKADFKQFEPWRPLFNELSREASALSAQASPLLKKARKLRAMTPAGIYAKALAVRCSCTGAALLCMSLAEDLVANTALRASLWPAEGGGQ